MPKGKVKKWTDEEDQFLKRNSKRMTASELMKMFNVSWIQIHHRCKKLGISPVRKSQKRPQVKIWTIEEDQFLKRNSENMTVSEFMKTINASRIQINHRCKKLGISPKKNYRTWTIQELQIAMNNPCAIASEKLNRTRASISSRKYCAKKSK